MAWSVDCRDDRHRAGLVLLKASDYRFNGIGGQSDRGAWSFGLRMECCEMVHDRKALLRDLYEAAVRAAHPDACLPAHLPLPHGDGRIVVVGAGKAAAAMATVAERHYLAADVIAQVTGCLTPPYGYVASLGDAAPEHLALAEARHPTPDAASEEAAGRAHALAVSALEDDVLLVLLSGGASSLWAAPAGIDLATKTALTRGLLKSGADIHEMNTVRRHLSRIKGGRLAAAGRRAGRILTLAISDVPGDDPATIGSGPTVPDPTSLADARAVLERRAVRMEALGLGVPDAVRQALNDPANETPKPGDPVFARAEYRIIATPRIALDSAAEMARRAGYRVIDLGDCVTGEARDVAAVQARMALEARQRGERVAILSGGELEVTVRNRSGRGGRSQEYALALALAFDGVSGVAAIAADTDGIDGGEGLITDPAGAIVDGRTVADGRARHMDAAKALDNNDATPYLQAVEALVTRGPTHTNVNDFRMILVDPDA
jgi:hydroxypyruvate reductase